jgi:hypothetical protein
LSSSSLPVKTSGPDSAKKRGSVAIFQSAFRGPFDKLRVGVAYPDRSGQETPFMHRKVKDSCLAGIIKAGQGGDCPPSFIEQRSKSS